MIPRFPIARAAGTWRLSDLSDSKETFVLALQRSIRCSSEKGYTTPVTNTSVWSDAERTS
jgi:hypothetical protein